jgi:hypothetical protein
MLKFNYCECGCHGFESKLTGFWIAINDSTQLHKGHGWTSPKLVEFESFEKAVEHATELAKPILEKMEETTKELRRQINSRE